MSSINKIRNSRNSFKIFYETLLSANIIYNIMKRDINLINLTSKRYDKLERLISAVIYPLIKFSTITLHKKIY